MRPSWDNPNATHRDFFEPLDNAAEYAADMAAAEEEARCPYGNSVRIHGKLEPCGTAEVYCGRCRLDFRAAQTPEIA